MSQFLSQSPRVFNDKTDESSTDQFMYRLNTEILNGLIPAIVEYLSEDYSEYYRIGAIYFLYAVYMNQPLSVEVVKVCVSQVYNPTSHYNV